MAIITSLLVAAPMLQDYFVDKTTGDPLAGGILTFYQDMARTVLKNVYYQVGPPSNYTYIPFSNPLILSASGTIQDNNGNDVIPFFYPYDETNSVNPAVQTYYVTVYSANQDGSPAVLQFTRENFPKTDAVQNTNAAINTNKGYSINKEFWRNIGIGNNITALSTVVAPSQHEGFSMPDIRYIRSANDALETISFFQFVPPGTAPQFFPDQVLSGDITPEFYFNLNCTTPGTELSKVLQIPIQLHIKALSGATGTVTFQAMNVGGNPNNEVTISILQFLGTGSPVVVTPPFTQVITNAWAKYSLQVILPSAQNVVTSVTGDDALYLQLGFPAGQTCNINIAMPSFYLGTNPPTNDFSTYDQISAITSSPRTGDIRTSLNSFQPFGWILMNDGTIGSATSGSTARANIDTWPLFDLIWNLFHLTPALAPIFTSAGAPTVFGASSFADFSADKRLSLTKSAGRVFANIGITSANSVPVTGGSNTGVNWAIGQTTGNELHSQSAAEVGVHGHVGSTLTAGLFAAGPGAEPVLAPAIPGPTSLNIANNQVGPVTPMNVQVPVTYMHVFIKL